MIELQRDKKLHIVAGLAISTLTLFGINYLIVIGLVFGAAIFKDVIWDLILKKGTFEVWDIVATIVPGTLSSLLINFFLKVLI